MTLGLTAFVLSASLSAAFPTAGGFPTSAGFRRLPEAPTLRPAPAPSTLGGAIAMSATGGAVLLAGVLLGTVGFVPLRSQLDASCPSLRCEDTPATRALYGRAQGLAIGSDVLLGVGALLTASGLLWVLGERLAPTIPLHRRSFTLGVSPTSLFLQGSF